jgi:DNA-binding transcriptional MerR regulator
MAPNGDLPLFGGALSMAAAPHRSIGEVLALLKDEFPDITISKIRFLESQGLLDPERTPSGYRRFYDKDVERLRWILRQQRENFLPLKVIKGRLAEGLDTADDATGDEPIVIDAPAPADAPAEPVDAAVPAPITAPVAPEAADPSPPTTPGAPGAPVVDQPVPGAPAPDVVAAAPAAPPSADGNARRVLPEPALFAHRPPDEPSRPMFSELAGSSSVSLTAEELGAACGLSAAVIADLERFGLIEHRSLGSTPVYDDDALLVARAAAVFLSYGIEARHLRMYKVAADRESGVFEQVVLPLVHQRNPEARRQAADTVDELARLGQLLHSAMLRRALKNIT